MSEEVGYVDRGRKKRLYFDAEVVGEWECGRVRFIWERRTVDDPFARRSGGCWRTSEERSRPEQDCCRRERPTADLAFPSTHHNKIAYADT